MKIYIVIAGQSYHFDVNPDETLLAILNRIPAPIKANIGFPIEQAILSRVGNPALQDLRQTPRSCGLRENETLTLQQGAQNNAIRSILQNVIQQRAGPTPTPTPQPAPSAQDAQAQKNLQIRNIIQNLGQQSAPRQPQRPQIPNPEVFRAEVLATPDLLQQLLHNDPILAEAVLSEDTTLLVGVLEQRALQKQQQKQKELEEINRLNADPFSVEAQASIEERIRQENVLNNMENAMEYHPESFGRVIMLYIPCVVNGVPVQAFVDSGAQQTIMSVECAKRCGIMRLVDTRFSGVAQGVGSAPIIGKVHLAQIKIGSSFFPCSFTILDGAKQSLDFLLGLDMLKRHQCNINLRDGTLQIGTETIEFLSEGQILEKMGEVSEEDEARVLEAQRNRLPGAVDAKEKSEKERQTPNQHQQTYPEQTIQDLQAIGNYSRADVIEALKVCDGSVDAAVNYLLEQK